jgi:hypothetical protein
MFDHEPIHVTVPGDAGDPRSVPEPPPGVVSHRVPALHPDDVTVVEGIPVTSVACRVAPSLTMLYEVIAEFEG